MDAELIIEVALLTAKEPLSNAQLRQIAHIPQDALNDVLENLHVRWKQRALQLQESAQGWRFCVESSIAEQIPHLLEEKKPRYSRAVLETLAVIAYHQPATRGDIEAIRGVSVSSGVLHLLQERGWIEEIGKKDSPGRPVLWATTKQFLSDLQLNTLSDLPNLESLGEVIEVD